MADGSRTKLGTVLEEERARILEELHQSQERYRVFFDTAFAGIGLTDAEETFTLANTALEEMLGFGPELVGISLASVTSSKEFDRYRAFTRKRRQGCWNRPRAVRSFSTKSPICRWTCRSSWVLQERRVRRLGGQEDFDVDFRLVSAANESLEEAMCRGPMIEPDDLPGRILASLTGPRRGSPDDFEEARRLFEREYLEGLLRRSGGNVSHAAHASGMHRSTFIYEIYLR